MSTDEGTAAAARDTDAGEWTGDAIHDEVRRRLLDGKISRSDVIFETSLSSEFGVSRTPVREALVRLMDAGLLERGSRGFRVRRLTPSEVLDLYQARIALESEAAALAAERLLPLDLARLAHLTETAVEEDGDVQREVSAAWHRAIRAACHNTALQGLLERVSVQLRLSEVADSAPPSDYAANRADHEAVVAALHARAPEDARAAMRAHLSRVRDLRTAAYARLAPRD